jgi:hypothetical protein
VPGQRQNPTPAFALQAEAFGKVHKTRLKLTLYLVRRVPSAGGIQNPEKNSYRNIKLGKYKSYI